jgi:hypothetical protein
MAMAYALLEDVPEDTLLFVGDENEMKWFATWLQDMAEKPFGASPAWKDELRRLMGRPLRM